MIHIGLFEGIGGFSLAARWAGWKTYATCEIAEFPRKVLKYYFPNAYHHGDIKTLTYETINAELSARYGADWRNEDVIITGGFPCQPYSAAGKRLGKEDDRHLWPEMLRVIREVRPTWIVGENVLGLVNWSGGLVFEEVQVDLEVEGYEVQAFVLPAASVGAPHRRDRAWFVAKNTMCSRRVFGKLKQEAAKDGEQRNTCAGDCNRFCSEKNAEFVTYANDSGGSAEPGQIQSEDGEVPKRHNNAELGNAGDGVVADTASNRRQWERQRVEVEKGLQQESRTAWELEGGSEGLCGKGDVADTDNKRHEECDVPAKPIKQGLCDRTSYENVADTKRPRERGNRFTESERPESGAWDNWPTVKPTICSGDDGLPDRLDNITFPKWRNESIKAYGNAIVPQVALQIFKAINEYDVREKTMPEVSI